MKVGGRRIGALILVAAVLSAIVLGSLNASIPVVRAQDSPPSYEEVYNAYEQALDYINNLKRVVYDPNTWQVKYEVIAEYPALPVWGKLNGFEWIAAFRDVRNCAGAQVYSEAFVDIDLASEQYYPDKSVWVYDYTFHYVQVLSYEGAMDYELAKLRVIEEQRSDGYYTITVTALSYDEAPALYSCPAMNGGDIKVYVGGAYAGTVSELMSAPWQSTYSLPQPSFRISLRHVQVMADLFFQAIGQPDEALHDFVLDALKSIFEQDTTPFDLYGNALSEYPVTLQVKDVVEIQFYDAHWFPFYTTYELGYDRLLDWMASNGFTDASNPGVFYPLYPYKSRVVAAAEASGANGGTLFIDAISWGAKKYCGDEDPLYNAWKGLYYAAEGEWGQALAEWYNVIDNWDGTGVKACYSSGYSTVRLALAIMLGTLLAKHGYLGWSVVDEMVKTLLKAQWKGSGYYKPENGDWVYIYKNDHKGGFLVSYAKAPDNSLGFAPFRPGWTELLTNANAMKPEYVGVIPTNAETTLAALIALKLYMDSRY